MTGIDWNRTLREIEREYDGLPPAASVGSLKAKKAAESAAKEAAKRRSDRLWVILRLIPVLALSVGILYWPYYARCGVELAGYLGAVAAVVAGGTWIAVTTWRCRMPLIHTLALLVVAWGLAMTAREVLPRAGYAKPDPDRVAWRCPAH
ncbi:MAG: hypothetical protein HOQ11_15410 [Gemmatimonadaceae bacterium]|nr:hypothetical protein [Gemmatimonadaceae bacterium]NUQ91728.1 hypothetical protein [Gemmatimonadaceae bacterium]NUR19355.1 hypothetical protein [Gemmatimonadaceae bacterium]NUS98789.1 hypothetical protein [Gemmatimonadaceae bacterium]